jgi:hypothetical protein
VKIKLDSLELAISETYSDVNNSNQLTVSDIIKHKATTLQIFPLFRGRSAQLFSADVSILKLNILLRCECVKEKGNFSVRITRTSHMLLTRIVCRHGIKFGLQQLREVASSSRLVFQPQISNRKQVVHVETFVSVDAIGSS